MSSTVMIVKQMHPCLLCEWLSVRFSHHGTFRFHSGGFHGAAFSKGFVTFFSHLRFRG